MDFYTRISNLIIAVNELNLPDYKASQIIYTLRSISEMLDSIEDIGEEAWYFLRNFSNSENLCKGFMICQDPIFRQIEQKYFTKPSSESHSGASFGLLMRQVEYIACHGFDAFSNDLINSCQPIL
jgi:hypothetical protein